MICRSDGYPMREVYSFEASPHWVCTNRWHPYHPGPCPACGHTGNHHAVGMGIAGVLCARCAHWWVPDVCRCPETDGVAILPPVPRTDAASA
jgi:hypothetical protein